MWTFLLPADSEISQQMNLGIVSYFQWDLYDPICSILKYNLLKNIIVLVVALIVDQISSYFYFIFSHSLDISVGIWSNE